MRDFEGDWDLGISSFTYGDIWGWDLDMEFSDVSCAPCMQTEDRLKCESLCTVSCGMFCGIM